MEEKDKMLTAIIAHNKDLSFEQLRDQSSLYTVGATTVEDIWKYTLEIEEEGVLNFRNKYAETLRGGGYIIGIDPYEKD